MSVCNGRLVVLTVLDFSGGAAITRVAAAAGNPAAARTRALPDVPAASAAQAAA